jgi:soluble lytic murein transglycosylase-like protein
MISKIYWESNLWADRVWENVPGLNPSPAFEKGSPNSSMERFFLAFLSKIIEKIISESGIETGSPAMVPPFSLEVFPARAPAPANPSELGNKANTESKHPAKGQDFDAPIAEAAARYDLDPAFIRAVIQVESNRNPAAVSPAGARGLMQLMPRTAAELGVSDVFDPAQNIEGGTRYLRQLLDRYRGDRRLALAAYNWGMGNLEKRPEGLPRETQRYILQVEKAYNGFLNRA